MCFSVAHFRCCLTLYTSLFACVRAALCLQNSSVGAYTSKGFVEVLAASQSNVRKEWFQGTADAVRQYMWLFEEAMRDGVQDFLILSGTGRRTHVAAGSLL